MYDGTYLGRLTGATTILSTRKGTPGIELRFSVGYVSGLDTNGNAAWNEIEPVTALVWCWLSPDSKTASRKKLEGLGFNGDFDLPEFSQADEVALTLAHETYEGKEREKWELANWGGAEKAPVDQTRQLATWWKAGSATTKPGGRPKAPDPKPDPKQAAAAMTAQESPDVAAPDHVDGGGRVPF